MTVKSVDLTPMSPYENYEFKSIPFRSSLFPSLFQCNRKVHIRGSVWVLRKPYTI